MRPAFYGVGVWLLKDKPGIWYCGDPDCQPRELKDMLAHNRQRAAAFGEAVSSEDKSE
jgi:hypothetical protein